MSPSKYQPWQLDKSQPSMISCSCIGLTCGRSVPRWGSTPCWWGCPRTRAPCPGRAPPSTEGRAARSRSRRWSGPEAWAPCCRAEPTCPGAVRSWLIGFSKWENVVLFFKDCLILIDLLKMSILTNSRTNCEAIFLYCSSIKYATRPNISQC